jgi:hypothetical protein
VQSVELVSWKFFGQLYPPSVPAFLPPLCSGKKSSTQVGLQEIHRKNPYQDFKP